MPTYEEKIARVFRIDVESSLPAHLYACVQDCSVATGFVTVTKPKDHSRRILSAVETNASRRRILRKWAQLNGPYCAYLKEVSSAEEQEAEEVDSTFCVS